MAEAIKQLVDVVHDCYLGVHKKEIQNSIILIIV